MAKRTKASQTVHNQAVKTLARQLSKQGWKVCADLPGYCKPKPVGKSRRIPDIEATRRGATKLVEVETRGSVRSDKGQHSSFRRSAAHRKRTTFDILVVED